VDYYPEGTLIWLDVDVQFGNSAAAPNRWTISAAPSKEGPGGAPAMKPL